MFIILLFLTCCVFMFDRYRYYTKAFLKQLTLSHNSSIIRTNLYKPINLHYLLSKLKKRESSSYSIIVLIYPFNCFALLIYKYCTAKSLTMSGRLIILKTSIRPCCREPLITVSDRVIFYGLFCQH